MHILEKKILKALQGSSGASIDDICNGADIVQDQARRALEWLKEKNLVEISYSKTSEISLGTEGRKVAIGGLPERRIVAALAGKKSVSLPDLQKLSGLVAGEFSAALGAARALGWIEMKREADKTLVLLKAVAEPTDEEKLVSKHQNGTIDSKSLSSEEKRALANLMKRPNFIQEKVIQTPVIRLSRKGASIAGHIQFENEIEALTSDIIVSNKWQGSMFRPLNVDAPAPALYPGKKHPLQRFVDEVREIFTSMGFEEIEGNLVQPSFWNFDALFTPQDHPSREMQDTFYLAGQKSKNLADSQTIERVSSVHRDGGQTGSRGWEYQWKIEEAQRTVLRTHTTCITVRYLADNKPEEARVFSIGRVFRNEKVSYKHIVEFNQVEGIVVGKAVTMRDMMGILQKFFERLGFHKTKFWPSYFPYTEPSLQSMVYFEKLDKWLELGGMGIFRPEVALPLGVKNPVLAWGLGLERLVMLRYGLDDIREVYGNNLRWLRSVPLCP
ncbi:MAG: phenylalanine--tRNA ligase subunit alpha [Thaumarchaeota archaeon]|nr:phenylalanine--tRNA ligase subunit alpha [Nitrososphaerota archaeon]